MYENVHVVLLPLWQAVVGCDALASCSYLLLSCITDDKLQDQGGGGWVQIIVNTQTCQFKSILHTSVWIPDPRLSLKRSEVLNRDLDVVLCDWYRCLMVIEDFSSPCFNKRKINLQGTWCSKNLQTVLRAFNHSKS